MKVAGIWGFLFLFVISGSLFSQNDAANSGADSIQRPVLLRQTLSGPYTMVERSDWARYDNGKYTGHVYRELRYQLTPLQESGGTRYSGTVYVFEETLRDLQKSARSLDDIIPVEFTLTPNGAINMKHDEGYPSLRNFPLFTDKPLLPGDRWVGQGQRIVDPRNDGNRVSLPIVVEYVFQGQEQYKGESVYHITAQYATRYKGPVQSGKMGSGAFTEATGKHVVDILLRTIDGRPLLMRDLLDETFMWGDGSSVRYKGFTLTFSEGFLPFDKGAVVTQLARQFGGGEGTNVPETVRSGAAAPGGSASSDGDVRGAASSSAVTSEESGVVGGGTGAAVPGGASTGSAKGGSSNNAALGGSGAAGAETSGAIAGAATAVAASSEGPDTVSGDFQLDHGSGLGVTSPALDLPDQNIEIAAVPQGVKLTVKDIRFVADSDQILPAERGRLDLIARSLLSVLQSSSGNPMILVEGHTAAVGKTEGEQELSVRRAKKIVDELVGRGIPADRFMYKGWGGTKPIADNNSEAGRAKNRRVEITILQ